MDEEKEECERRWWFISYKGVPDGGSPLPCLPAAPGAVPDRARLRYFRKDGLHDAERAMAPYALLLSTMVEIVGSSDLQAERVTFGSALDDACERLEIDRAFLPQEMEELLLRSSFSIITAGGFPGAAEAG